MGMIENYLYHTWRMVAEMGPYLLLGFGVAGILHRYLSQEVALKLLGGKGFKSIFMGSLVGVPMPLCSCSVIPVTASLRQKGASKAAAASFLASTPQTGIDSILATYGMLGPVFAVYRAIVALLSGLLVGLAVGAVDRDAKPATPRASSSDAARPTWLESVKYGAIDLPGEIAGALAIGFLLAGAISALIPADALTNIPGGALTAVLAATVIGVPFYICSTGSIPLAVALVANGFPPSAALVLLIVGPATSIATLTTMRVILGLKEMLAYLVCLILSAWGAAAFFHAYLDDGSAWKHAMDHESGISILSHLGGVALIGLLAWSAYRIRQHSHDPHAEPVAAASGEETLVLPIIGMTCGHCAHSVAEGLKKFPSVRSASVDMDQSRAVVVGAALDRDELAACIEKLGFKVGHD